MKNLKLPLSLFVALIVFYVAQALWFYPRLPPVMASHFGPSGQPDGWMSKESNLVVIGLLLGLMIFIFLVLPLLTYKIPPSIINLPNKEYWLAPERRAATIDSINRQMLWFGVATLFLLLIVTRYAFQENLAPSGRFSFRHFGPILLLYLIFVVSWIVALHHRFARKTG